MIDDITGIGDGVSLDPVATVTSTSTGSGVDISAFKGRMAIMLDSGAASAGTSPTLDVKIQESADDSTYSDISGATFTQVTDAAASFQQIAIDADDAEQYIRVVATVGGTSTPTFTYSVTGYGAKQTG